MTPLEIFAAVALKGAIFEFLRWRGLLPRHYLGEDASAADTAKSSATPKFFTDVNGNVWSVEEHPGGNILRPARAAKRKGNGRT